VNAEKPNLQSVTQIVVLGGGFAGVYAARRMEKLFARRDDVQIFLVSRDNFLLMTPLLFEVCSGKLEMSACSISIREFLRRVEFIEASVEAIDLDRRTVLVSSGATNERELRYDHLVFALGSLTNTSRIDGSSLPSRSRRWPMPSCCATMSSNEWSGRRLNPTRTVAVASLRSS